MSTQEHLLITKYDLLFESRLSKVEATMDSINSTLIELKADSKALRSEFKTDFRWLFSFMIGGFAGLFAIMAHGFHWY